MLAVERWRSAGPKLFSVLMRWYHLTRLLATGTVAACLFPPEPCACVLPPPAALAVGTVAFGAGNPAAGAAVVAESWRPPCDAVPPGFLLATDTTTNSQGAFRLVVIGQQEGTQCARITARLGAAEVSRVVTVQTRHDVRLEYLDSVRVDLTLP